MSWFEDKFSRGSSSSSSEADASTATPGRSTLSALGEVGRALNPLAGATEVGAAAGRYVGSLFANHNAPQAPAQQQGGAGGGGSAVAPQAQAGGGAVAITAPPGSPAFRVQTAAAAGNLAQVIQIQGELVAQQPRTDEINAGITAAREWMMERVASIRDSFHDRLDAARHASAGAAANQALGNVEQLEVDMNTQCGPYLEGLIHGDPQNRYLHHDHDITTKVFSAVRLRSARLGVSQLGHREDAERDARSTAHLPQGEWCGAFAYTQAAHGGGLAGAWAENMMHERAIRHALNYETATKWIFAEGTWHPIRAYHIQRGSERHYLPVLPGQPVPEVEPGDIVLKDNRGGVDPDHITTAITSDGGHIQTIGGNEGGNDPAQRAAYERGVARTDGSIDLRTQEGPNDNRLRDAQGRFIDGSNDDHHHKNSRVHGIGRWSIVDYEEHTYSPAPTMPAAPPANAGPSAHGGGGAARGGGGGAGGGGAGPASGGH